ncbi:MAG: PEP-utilizing enzyme [Gammaproteobacteria bacterium]|nr:PEP-utilizing enzyme [Gammaproteobacteria bacterium]
MYITGINAAPGEAGDDAGLEIVGGKGRSLARMAKAGFNVPGGFVVTAAAYRSFVSSNGLQQKIVSLARPAVDNGRASFEQASKAIQALFADHDPSAEITAEIREAYGSLTDVAVAVRSSANAEDLPGLSFAGQQETYLNVRGAEEVVAAVRNCWASLWTPQAISYRHQNGIDQDSVAMAVVVQTMVPSHVSGILFTANPATGERSEIVINASFGLGEAVVSGQVTPDTYIVDKETLRAKDTIIGPKAQQIVADGGQGTRLADVDEVSRGTSSLTDGMLRQLSKTAIDIESLYDGVPQDIEWAVVDGDLYLLQSRPITNLPVQPIEVAWEPPPPARILYRRQIVENMPDPICPLFEELYLTEGLEAPRKGKPSIMPGGGPHFVTCNGYAYNRADHPGNRIDPNSSEEELKAAFKRTIDAIWESRGDQSDEERYDMALFRSELSPQEQAEFDAVAAAYEGDNLAHDLTLPPSDNPTYVANNKTRDNDARWLTWQEEARPRLVGTAEKWRKLHLATATDEELLAGIREMGIEEGIYWTGNTSHTFGIAKSTDDQLQCFLHENLPGDHYISGQFLTGFESKTLRANAILFEIAKLVRASEALTYLVIVTPTKFLLPALQEHAEGGPILEALDEYFDVYGHQGYSLDFIEPTQAEDPSATVATLKSMVQNADYDPKNQEIRATAVREAKFEEVREKLSGLTYWQFRYRLWFGRRYNHIREETAFYFGYTWSVLRPMAFELGSRLVDAGTFLDPEDTFFMVTDELKRAIEARKAGAGLPELGRLAAERRELREARKLLHPPGTIPAEASNIPSVRFKETQIRNDASEGALNGFAVSSGRVTAPASVILSQNDFDRMEPGSILVAPNTTPAWTQLFAHAVGLVTDMGSILAHGSIVAREYGIPAVLGVGNGTVRIKHGQSITIDGDAGSVMLHEDG